LTVRLYLPKQVLIDQGVVGRLPAILAGLDTERVLLIHGRVVERFGLVSPVLAALQGSLSGVFEDSHSPTDDETAAAVSRIANRLQPDAVVAVGGGSAIDAGKVAVHTLPKPVPLLALSTTLSGAELTPDCGIVDSVRKVKKVLRGQHLVATAALYDPDFLQSLDKRTLAGSAMNAMAHCVEALYTPLTNRLIQSLALAGANALYAGLQLGYVDGDTERARDYLVEGGFCAGVACGNGGIALHHAICHSLGPQLGISHGHANTVMLPYVMRFNSESAGAQFARLGVALGVGAKAEDAISAIEGLRHHLGLPLRLGELGLTPEIARTIAEHVMTNPRVLDNPRKVDIRDVESIVMSAV
jgi:maleylacetate reductase